MSRIAYSAAKKDFIYDLDTNVFMNKMCEGAGIELCVGGPRESECGQAYDIARELLSIVLDRMTAQ